MRRSQPGWYTAEQGFHNTIRVATQGPAGRASHRMNPMKTIHLFLAAVLSFCALQAHARSAVPIVNHHDVVVTRGSGQPA